MSAQRPNPGSNSKKQGSLLRDLEETKLEGDPLTLSGTGTAGTFGANPTAAGAIPAHGDRLILRETTSPARKLALGVDTSERLWFQSYTGGFDWWTSPLGPQMRLVTLGGGGGLKVGGVTADPHSTLHVGGSLALLVGTMTAGDPVDAHDCVVVGDATGGSFTITLPAAAGCTGRVYSFVRYNGGVNTVTIDGNGAETINGAATKRLDSQYASITLVNDGIEWFILAQMGTVT